VTSFTTSLGASINMDGACIHFVLCSVLFARLYGIPLDVKMIATSAVAVFILSMGDSAVQNSSLISMTGILTLMGAPTAALGLILGIDAILDIFRCGSNIIGDLVATIAIGKSEGEMTVEKYQSRTKKAFVIMGT
jgi:Na+/H+-dicarboxylate symporter